MEYRNRLIFRILLIVSAVIALVQTASLAVLLEEHLALRIAIPLLLLLGEGLTGGVLVFSTLYPNKFNRNYTLHRRDGRLRWELVTYGSDPDGLRYISAGINVLAAVLLFVVIADSILWPAPMEKYHILPISIIALLILIALPYSLIERKLRK